MKRSRLILSAAGALAVAGYMASSGLADIENSLHNFSPFGWSKGRICLPCHTPHHADTSVVAPLWNHALTTANNYILFGGDAGGVEDLDERSVLCMSCHDGTVALDSFGGNNGAQYIGGAGLIGTDLSDDHPVGGTAVYPLGVSWMRDPAEWENTPRGFELHEWTDPDTNEVFDVVSCYTCHEPHKRGGNEHMLWVNNAGSALCLTCHIK